MRRNETLAEWSARVDAKWAKIDASTHWVYRVYDDYGLLLYIGCTVDVDQRMSQHRSTAPWFDYATTTAVFGPFDGKAAGRTAERNAIDTEGAYFNAAQADINATQANRNAARKVMEKRGRFEPRFTCDEDCLYDGCPKWDAYTTDSERWRAAVEEIRADLKNTTRPYLTDSDRSARYLAAREDAALAWQERAA